MVSKNWIDYEIINGNNHTIVESHYRHKIQAILIDNIQSTFLLININKYYPLKLLLVNFDRWNQYQWRLLCSFQYDSSFT